MRLSLEHPHISAVLHQHRRPKAEKETGFDNAWNRTNPPVQCFGLLKQLQPGNRARSCRYR